MSSKIFIPILLQRININKYQPRFFVFVRGHIFFLLLLFSLCNAMETNNSQDDQENVFCSRGQYYNYPKDSIQEAVEKIRNNEMSYGEASRVYGIPQTTLYNKTYNTFPNSRGAKTTLTKAQEDELAQWILKHQEYGDPRTKQDIMNTA